ncbi:porin [Colwellia sp. RSH04]|uniref:porin n=1 Tax=Colwellia sp. RSH04 TaxID=2305464 RepID=UPI000E57FF6A|nr:porin [Colwellia sp. RSH04]RHW75925.1 porin [Colwellia sp. RSH04]
MKLIKKSLVLSICSVLALPAIAADAKNEMKEVIDFYGKLNISLQASAEDGDTFNELKSNASRVGVKGKYKLDHGLTAIYKLEWQVNVNDDSKDTLTARNQWVGIKGGFGELTAGRSDTTLKVSQGKFDLFNDYEGDLKHLFIGENRVSDALTYKSPTYMNLQFLGSYIISDDKDASDPYSLGVFFGDLNLKKTDFFIGFAHDENMPVKFKRKDNEGNSSNVTVGLANTRVTGMYRFGDLRLGAMFVDSESTESGNSETGYAVNVSYKFGKVLAKAQYQEFAGEDAISVGADYKLGKNTKVYAWYTDRAENKYLANDGYTYNFASQGEYIGIGMEQKF